MDDRVNELERQVQRGSLFTHTLLTEQAERANTTEALVNGLIDVLIQDGVGASGRTSTPWSSTTSGSRRTSAATSRARSMLT